MSVQTCVLTSCHWHSGITLVQCYTDRFLFGGMAPQSMHGTTVNATLRFCEVACINELQTLAFVTFTSCFCTSPLSAWHITQTCVQLIKFSCFCRWTAVYPLLAMVNHSCCPNSNCLFLHKTTILRAGQDLKAGMAQMRCCGELGPRCL